MTGGGRGHCVTSSGGGVQRGFGIRRRPRSGYRGRGLGWRWDDPPIPADMPPGGFQELEGLAEQIRTLASRVEALSVRLEASERKGE